MGAGPLAFVVKFAGFVIATGIAIRLGWMRRSRWMPPEETVPDATTKMASLFTGVAVVLLYMASGSPNQYGIYGIIIAVAFVATLVTLATTIYLSTTLSFQGRAGTRVLGGFKLTSEAAGIHEDRRVNEQELF